jgi:hypothetical protein
MTFKQHAMGKIEERPVHEQFEAKFHQLLCPALDRCVNMGNKKKQGYIMGAFREALADFRVKTPEQTAQSVELTREEADILYNIVANMQKAAQVEETICVIPEHRVEFRRQVEMFSAIKVKLMVHKLMEVKSEQAE